MGAAGYHVDLPYPAVNGLKPNRQQAMMLMEGYSGRKSELTTVTQYAYHHIKCKNNRELARALKGIFLVEAHHLELLGNCINQLGYDPKYYIYSNKRYTPWNAGVVDYENSIRDMILADIDGEKGAADYYIKTAAKIGDNKLARLLLRLSEDEKLHVRIFSDLYDKYFNK